MELTDKQERFCQEYLVDFNATKAATRAGYSKKTAHSIGSENLTKPEIQKRLAELFEQTGEKLGITRERTMREIGRLAFTDIRQFYTVDGALKNITDLDDDAAAALAGVEVMEEKVSDPDADEVVVAGQVKKIKIYDKTKALEMLAKHFKIYDDAPVINNQFDLSKLSAEDLKALLTLKKKVVQ
jgi:phage terminase small subunit